MAKRMFFVFIFCVCAAGMVGCASPTRSSYVGNNYTQYNVKQTIDNVHHYAMDGEQGEVPKGEEDITR